MPAERILATLIHTSSRTLVLFSIAKGKQAFFWLGFLILTAIDSAYGAFLLAGNFGTGSDWVPFLICVPIGLVSIPIIRWCIHNWPAAMPSGAVKIAESEVAS
jgi:ABC-type multidrug transport system permease subunit